MLKVRRAAAPKPAAAAPPDDLFDFSPTPQPSSESVFDDDFSAFGSAAAPAPANDFGAFESTAPAPADFGAFSAPVAAPSFDVFGSFEAAPAPAAPAFDAFGE